MNGLERAHLDVMILEHQSEIRRRRVRVIIGLIFSALVCAAALCLENPMAFMGVTAIMLMVAVDAYAMYTLRVRLRTLTNQREREDS